MLQPRSFKDLPYLSFPEARLLPQLMDEIWLYNQLSLVVYPSIYKGFSTIQPVVVRDFWTINSRMFIRLQLESDCIVFGVFNLNSNTSVTPKNGHGKHTCQDRPSVEQILTRARELVTWYWYLKMDESKEGDFELEKPNMWRFLCVKKSGESYHEMEKPKSMNVDGTWWSKMKVYI